LACFKRTTVGRHAVFVLQDKLTE